MNNNEEPYVPPFVRRLMPNATEEEIQEAAANLKGFVDALYRMYVAAEARGTLPRIPSHVCHMCPHAEPAED